MSDKVQTRCTQIVKSLFSNDKNKRSRGSLFMRHFVEIHELHRLDKHVPSN